MIQFVLATHGKLGEGIMDSISMIMGEYKNIYLLPLTQEMSIDNYKEKLKEIVDKPHTETIIFTDLFMGSPFNKSAELFKNSDTKNHLFVVTGMNLPMIIEAINSREMNDSAKIIVENSLEIGREGIKNIYDFLN